MRISSLPVAVLAVLLLSLGSLCARAQNSSNGENSQNRANPVKTPNPNEPKKTSLLDPQPGDWRMIEIRDGEYKPIQNQDYQDLIKQAREAPQNKDRPQYSFSDVSLEGTATDEEVILTITLSLQITEETYWVRVPLGLKEAVLKGFRHEFKPVDGKSGSSKIQGQACFDTYSRRTFGYRWWFQGKGHHVLTLKTTVPLKKASGARRLQLAVPTAASSYLRLALPIAQEQLSLETMPGGVHKTRALGKLITQVEVFRLGQQLDLGWRALPDYRQIDTLLTTKTEIRVEPNEESILLKARQWIEPLQGSMKQVEVSLPGGFKIIELKVNGERSPALDDDPDLNKPVKIPLPAATTDRLRLEWILQAPWPESGQLILEGFQVADSLQESGEIAILGYEGYRIVKRSAKDVVRTNVRELLGPGPIYSAYQFPQQPFQLILELQKIQPSYSIHPHLFLKMGHQQIEMLIDLEIQVFRGVVQTLELDWKRPEEQGWIIDQAGLPGEVEQIETDPETGRLRIQLGKRLTHGEPIQLRLRANRMVEHPEEEFPITLPRVIGSNPEKSVRTVVVITNRENVVSRVTPLEETETRPLPANLAEKVEKLLNLPDVQDFRGPRQQSFLVTSREHRFRASIMTHPQSIQCETRVKVTIAEEKSFAEQELQFHVKYERASELRVMVPEAFPSQIQFSLGP
ncbi:MAG: hypothetical protein KDA84_09920, partial [Planctomycetaceae bacterium]|nr:hypothetical protein [Planctomycetaceae bacterium]